ncbi:hypothetical protein BC939DRAFT_445669 [Gamsiella multidivaricata]|uniref:uncharacterized protein n=1 Tax=Gamsiella multidivaricata TaxID=101098 RepID=UPI00221F5DA9|nr:uncharacterized protein BC939DRAFT_445669 [Gamsiella multidivaricata]KAI7827066.1 hypothetical protein BC939DRAFT_445669 [Gamsiella multidivaricata]
MRANGCILYSFQSSSSLQSTLATMYTTQQSTSLFLGGDRTSGQNVRDQNGRNLMGNHWQICNLH